MDGWGKPSSESYGHRGLVGIGGHTSEDVSRGGKVEQSVRGGGGRGGERYPIRIEKDYLLKRSSG